MFTLFMIIVCIATFCDIYWYLQYHDETKERYWYGKGIVLKFTIGIGIKKKEITRGDGEQYLTRYSIHSNKCFAIKLHKIYASDDACLHDHPWAFVSFVLKNGYVEETFKGDTEVNPPEGYDRDEWRYFISEKQRKRITAPAILYRPANWAHRLIITKPATTLVITFKKIRNWGFFTPDGWIFWRNYRQDKMDSCE